MTIALSSSLPSLFLSLLTITVSHTDTHTLFVASQTVSISLLTQITAPWEQLFSLHFANEAATRIFKKIPFSTPGKKLDGPKKLD